MNTVWTSISTVKLISWHSQLPLSLIKARQSSSTETRDWSKGRQISTDPAGCTFSPFSYNSIITTELNVSRSEAIDSESVGAVVTDNCWPSENALDEDTETPVSSTTTTDVPFCVLSIVEMVDEHPVLDKQNISKNERKEGK